MSSKNKKIRMTKNQGVTLIALVVTVFILIILATVGISAVFGENGFLKKAQSNKSQTESSIEKERRELNELMQEYDAENGVANLPEDAVARTKEKFYTSLKLAIDDAKENTKTQIFLLKDIKENVTIPQNKDIELYMMGHTQNSATENQVIISLKRKAAYYRWKYCRE